MFGLNLGRTDGYRGRARGYGQERGPVAPVRPYIPTQERLTNTPSGETLLQVFRNVTHKDFCLPLQKLYKAFWGRITGLCSPSKIEVVF